MKERILNYRNRIDNLIGANSEETDWGAVIDEHLVQIGFFQHERLIHLIVTVLFGLATVITIPACLITVEPALMVLGGLFLCLLFPYIIHYFHLENGVPLRITEGREGAELPGWTHTDFRLYGTKGSY